MLVVKTLRAAQNGKGNRDLRDEIKAAELRRLHARHQLAIQEALKIAAVTGTVSPEYAAAEKAISAVGSAYATFSILPTKDWMGQKIDLDQSADVSVNINEPQGRATR